MILYLASELLIGALPPSARMILVELGVNHRMFRFHWSMRLPHFHVPGHLQARGRGVHGQVRGRHRRRAPLLPLVHRAGSVPPQPPMTRANTCVGMSTTCLVSSLYAKSSPSSSCVLSIGESVPETKIKDRTPVSRKWVVICAPSSKTERDGGGVLPLDLLPGALADGLKVRESPHFTRRSGDEFYDCSISI